MATYHLNVRGCSKSKGQSASAKSDYINREDKYTKNKDDLIYSASGNMPSFAKDNPKDFWKSADEFERANARVCTEIEFALPRELNLEQQKELITEFINKNLDNDNHKLTYSYAIHNDKNNHNPHCHLIFSERNNDGIERTADQYFRRANNKTPEKGGAKKSEHAHKKDFVQEVRTSWRELANEHLAKAGFKNTIDERTLEAQGIDRESPRRLNRVEFKQLRAMEKELAFTGVLLNRADELITQIKQEEPKKALEEPLTIKPKETPIKVQEEPKKALEIDYREDEGFLAYKASVLHDLVMEKTRISKHYEGEINRVIATADKIQKEYDSYQDKKNMWLDRAAEYEAENKKVFLMPSTRKDNARRIEASLDRADTEDYFMRKIAKENGKYLNFDVDKYKEEMAEKLAVSLEKHEAKCKEFASYEHLVEAYKNHQANLEQVPSESIKQGFEKALSEVRSQRSNSEKQSNQIKNDGWSMDR